MRVLVLNDSFGALAASLAGKVKVTSSGDSFLAFQGLEKNLAPVYRLMAYRTYPRQ